MPGLLLRLLWVSILSMAYCPNEMLTICTKKLYGGYILAKYVVYDPPNWASLKHVLRVRLINWIIDLFCQQV